MALGDEAIQIVEAVDNPFICSEAYGSVGLLHLRQGDLPKAIPVLMRPCGLPGRDIQLFVPAFTANLGAAYALSGRIPEALPLLKQAVAQHTAMGRVSIRRYEPCGWARAIC